MEIIHRCTRKCPYNKHCFVCKTKEPVKASITVLHKCKVTKEEIPIEIGGYDQSKQ
ncbi:MAG: hypothetical protein ACLUW4_01025 [Butyribacter sp.]|uniref:hypothetical protein n=1 Tax=Clostridia TaxID=186801 RepID=UPI0015FAFCEA|nr:hypothetical protein [Clostridium sp. AM27-31LB]DAI70091.1 MAG TPA: hypothetical protein [Caudoviricetes sp.]